MSGVIKKKQSINQIPEYLISFRWGKIILYKCMYWETSSEEKKSFVLNGDKTPLLHLELYEFMSS